MNDYRSEMRTLGILLEHHGNLSFGLVREHHKKKHENETRQPFG
jgi:hypothetical protein